MPSLDRKDAREFWKNFLDGSVYQIVSFLEASETWALTTNSDVEVALAKLGDTLDQAQQGFAFDLTALVTISSTINMSQKLRIMQLVDSVSPGTATQMISHAEANASSNTYAALFLQRNMIFERMRILSRLLSTQRITTVQNVYEGD